MFQNISLWTCDGHLVADVSIPKFNPPAEVLTWGSRTFIRNAAGEYREGMNFVVPIELSSVPFSQKYCSVPSVSITDAKRSTSPADSKRYETTSDPQPVAIAQNASETKRVDVYEPISSMTTCGVLRPVNMATTRLSAFPAQCWRADRASPVLSV